MKARSLIATSGSFLLLLLLWLLGSGCGREAPRNPPSTNLQVFQVKGVVVAVRAREKQVEIRHEEIAGYMPAMTMPFNVKDTNELKGLEPGSPVAFRMSVTDEDGWIDQIRKLAATPASNLNALPQSGPPGETGQFRLVRSVQRLEPGDVVPNYQLTNQFGAVIHLDQFRGQAVALTFLFTRCPYPTFCPRMTDNFGAAKRNLLAMTNGPSNWQLLTVSFDPEFDQPAMLKAYAEGHQFDPAHWTFATGSLIDITALGEQFGLTFWHDPSGGINHNLRTVVLDTTGRVQKVFEGNTWTPDELVAELVRASSR